MEHVAKCETTQRAETAEAAWFLVGQIGRDGDLSHVAIKDSPFSIGRNPAATLCLPFRTVSADHAEIRGDGGDLILRDKQSTNGTFVNGRRVDGEIKLTSDDLIQFADIPMRACLQNPESPQQTLAEDVYDQAIALVQFDKLISERRVTPYYQPVVTFEGGRIVGYEVLGRSRLFGVSTPLAMFRTAAKLNLEVQLSRMLRWEGIQQSDRFVKPPHLFVNTHPQELSEPGLAESLAAVGPVNPNQPLTLEIHEAAVADEITMSELRCALGDLDISLAYDDFGSGRARLVELVKVRPEYLKFDMSLVRHIHLANAEHQQLVASLVRIVRELGIVALAEGVECREESETCRQLGFELGQGYFYGKPAPVICR